MSSLRILLIDDDQEVLAAVSKFLERRGYAVTGVASASAALDALHGHLDQCDLVITDVSVPGLDGLLVLKTVKDAWPHLPVILVGGYRDQALAEEINQLGAAEFLRKPLDGERLLTAIQQAIAQPSTTLAGALAH